MPSGASRRAALSRASRILSLAVGIGATTALANVARILLVAELPVERPDQLTWVFWSADLHMRVTNFGDDSVTRDGRTYDSNYSYPLYRAIKAVAPPRVEVAGFNVLRRVNVGARGRPPSVASGLIVSGDFFQALRLPVALGRPIGAADDEERAAPVVVITHAFWRETFGGDPKAVGSTLRINSTPFVIVGVTPPAFEGLSRGGSLPPADIIVPMAAQPLAAPSWSAGGVPLREDFRRQWVRIAARVPNADGRVRLASAAASALRQTLAGVAPADAELRGIDVRLLPADRGFDSLRNHAVQPLAVLSAVVTIFLLVTCTNLAGMLTARGLARRRELAVRRALGAARWRLVRQALVESVLLASAGGTIGALLAVWSGPALTAMLSDGLHAADVHLPVDWRFLGLAAVVTLATALVFGIVPALRSTRRDATGDLRDRGPGGGGRSRQSGGRALVAVQLAVSLPLLCGALLFVRTLRNFSAVDSSASNPAGLIVFEVNP